MLRIVLFLVPPLLWTGLPVGRVTSGAGLGWGLELSMVGLTSELPFTKVGKVELLKKVVIEGQLELLDVLILVCFLLDEPRFGFDVHD